MSGRRSAIASGTPGLPTCCSCIAVGTHAASIWFFSMPASAIASSKASTMRSSASRSQRSPNFEQPMPRTATLSLMPLAMSASLAEAARRRGLPEISDEAALRIAVFDAKHHVHAAADFELFRIDVGEIHHDAAADL